MLKIIFDWFFKDKPKDVPPAPTVAPEAAPYKVEAPVQPAVTHAPAPVAVEAKPAPKKKRTFVKRDESDAKSKVAKIKAPAKPKAPKKPKAK